MRSRFLKRKAEKAVDASKGDRASLEAAAEAEAARVADEKAAEQFARDRKRSMGRRALMQRAAAFASVPEESGGERPRLAAKPTMRVRPAGGGGAVKTLVEEPEATAAADESTTDGAPPPSAEPAPTAPSGGDGDDAASADESEDDEGDEHAEPSADAIMVKLVNAVRLYDDAVGEQSEPNDLLFGECAVLAGVPRPAA